MDGTEKNHPECGNPDLERHIWYAFTCMWILGVKSVITKLQSVNPQR